MLRALPNFRALHRLSQKHSAPLDSLMRSEIRLLLNTAPFEYHPRLKGILFEMSAYKATLHNVSNADFLVASRAHRALLRLRTSLEGSATTQAANDTDVAQVLTFHR